MSAAAVEARLVVRRHAGFTLDIGLELHPGRTVALLGPNGAGKSTAVAALAGLAPLDGGRIRLGERILDDPGEGIFVPPEERRIGVVFQDYVLFPHLTVAENIAFGLRSRRLPLEEIAGRVEQWIERLGLRGLERQRPGRLSGGQAQRVALARALATDPDLLLLDEPLAALDASTRLQLRRELAEHLDAFGGPRLLITHDPVDAFLLAGHVYVIEEGGVSHSGSPEEIRLRPRSRYAADLVGTNLLEGEAGGGVVTISGHPLHIADQGLSGSALVTVHPRAISLHRSPPEGSPRNSWATTVRRVEGMGDRVRVDLGAPLSLTAEVTHAALVALELAEGARVFVSIKATEIGVEASRPES